MTVMKLSDQLELIADALKTAPVNVFSLARNLGLGCYPALLGPNISGMIARKSDNEYRLSYNENDPITRQRFTVAHEIGHFVLQKHLIGDGVDDDRAYRSTLHGHYKNTAIGRREETQANAFAANLLMPEKLIRFLQAGDPGITPEELANRLGVSRQAMEIRLSSVANTAH